MADMSNRLWAGVAVGLVAALGVLGSGILGGDGGETAAEGIEQDVGSLGGLTTDDSPLAPSDQVAGSGDATARPPTLLVLAPDGDGAPAPATDARSSSSTEAPSASSAAAPATGPSTPAPAAPGTANTGQPAVSTAQDGGGSSAPVSSAPSAAAPATTATTMAPTSAPATTAPPATQAPSGSGSSFEQQVIDLTNAERRNAGCPDLTNNAKLHAAALAHSTDMATRGYFSHTGANGSSMQDRVEAQGYAWRSLAENIAAGHRTAQAVVTGWMNSSGHRANILNCGLTEIGVGFYDNHWTQNFGTPR